MIKTKKYKFAIIGTTCSGKTTMVFSLLSRLKKRNLLVDGVLSQDRRFNFNREKLETDLLAQYYVILNQAKMETEMMLKDDISILISDRSVLDFYAYQETMYGRDNMIFNFIMKWIDSYDALYYLSPKKYVDDGKRPRNRFRLKVDKVLDKLIQLVNQMKPGIIRYNLSEKDIEKDILSNIGVKYRELVKEDFIQIKRIVNKRVLIGGSYSSNTNTIDSDVDLYTLIDNEDDRIEKSNIIEQYLKRVFGIKIDITKVNKQTFDYLKTQGFKEICE